MLLSPIDIGDWFGSSFVHQQKDEVILGGINVAHFLEDLDTIWRNTRLSKNMFKKIRRYRIVVDQFFLPDIQYVLSQIIELKTRKSNKYRLKKLIDLINKNTWMKSTIEEHPDILDFTQLNKLKHKLYEHQINTLKVYNEKVPKMKLKGFLLSTPPGCLTGDTIIKFKRNNEEFHMFLEMAKKCYHQEGTEYQNWDLKIPTYVWAYVDNKFDYHEIHSVVYTGLQSVYRIKLENTMPLTCTDTHSIMTDEGYIKAQNILEKNVMIDDKYSENRLSYSKAISSEYFGLQDTYDIICKEPYHNFIANNIVVHNSGKTIMSIALSQCLHSDLSIYIVPKNTVTTVWFDGIVEELGPNVKVWASTHNEPINENYDHYIFHYEALPLAVYLAKRLMNSRKKPFIAIDESHNLNEITSIRTLRLVELVKLLNCQNTVFASGTPIKALGTETIPLLRCIDSFFTPEVETRFKAIYGLTAKRANDILRNRLGLISHKIAEDSYMTAPKPIEINLPVKIPNPKPFLISTIKAEMKEYMKTRYKFYESNMKQYIRIYNLGIDTYEKTLKTSQEKADLRKYKEYISIIIKGYDPIAHKEEAKYCKEFEKTKIIPSLPQSLKNQFKDTVSVIKFVKLKILGESLAIVGKKRALCAAELGTHADLEKIVLESDKKTIVFSSYIEALESTYDVFIKKKFKPLRIYGNFTKQLTELVNQFKTDPEVNPLFATLQSLSASQTLTNASTMVLLNHPFRNYIYDQAYHRIFRIGQDVQTYIYLLELDTQGVANISTRSADILDWSKSQVNALLGENLSDRQVEQIVERLHLNQNVSLLTGATRIFKDVIGI